MISFHKASKGAECTACEMRPAQVLIWIGPHLRQHLVRVEICVGCLVTLAVFTDPQTCGKPVSLGFTTLPCGEPSGHSGPCLIGRSEDGGQ